MATPSQHPRLTAADLLALEDDRWRHELEAGFLLSEPLPTPRHDRVRRRLETLLEAFVAEHRLGEVFGEAGFVLARDPDTVRGPDLSFVRAARLVNLDDSRFFEGAPDLAVEILSPSNRPYQVRAKVADYLEAGSQVVWVVDPEKRGVTSWRSILAPRVVGFDGELDGEDVLPGLRVPVAALFEG
jgi:Uma2 family endonuclease